MTILVLFYSFDVNKQDMLQLATLCYLLLFIYFSDSTSKIRPLFDAHVLNGDTFNVTVKPVPPGGGGLAYYENPSVDGRRKGAFYINTQNLKAQKKFQATTLTIHEALPGHHLQLSFNKHSPIPSFLRLASIPGFRIRAILVMKKYKNRFYQKISITKNVRERFG